jgi:hypothetical protein
MTVQLTRIFMLSSQKNPIQTNKNGPPSLGGRIPTLLRYNSAFSYKHHHATSFLNPLQVVQRMDNYGV